MRNVPLYLWFALVVRPIVRLLIGVNVFGRGHLRLERPSIIVANHNSHLDAAVLMVLIPWRALPRVRPVAAADYFEQNAFRRIVFRRLMNVLPIRRDKITRQNNPLTAMCEALDRGESIILFPEGTRGEPERMSEFQSGVVHLIAKRPDVPVVPVFMRNLGFSLPRNDVVLVPMFCDVYVGRPRRIEGSRDQVMAQLQRRFAVMRRYAERQRPNEAPEDDR